MPLPPILALLGLVAAWPLHAAPWPRPKGEVLAISAVNSEHHISHWVEYGIAPSRWLILEMDFPPRGGLVEGVLSFNQALPNWGGWTSSLGLGVAVTMPDPLSYPVNPKGGFQIGAAVGRGFSAPLPGWLSLAARMRKVDEYQRIKAELTLGLRPIERLQLIGQLQFSSGAGPRFALGGGDWRETALLASGMWQLTPRLGLELGLTQRINAPNHRPVVRIASWLRF